MPLTTERIAEIYDLLERKVIQLDPDPRSRGTTYLQTLIATCRNYLNDLDRVMREIHREDHRVASALRLAEVAYQVESDNLLANDERVRRLPNIEDRKSTVSVMLAARRQTVESLKTEAQDLKYVDKIVRHQHKQLTATMGEIKLQRSIIDAEIRTGAMYGDERTMATEGGADAGVDVAQLDSWMAEERAKQAAESPLVDTESPSAPEEPETPETPSGPDPGTAAIEKFLEIPEDFNDIFDDL
jgi:hypothetical protein